MKTIIISIFISISSLGYTQEDCDTLYVCNTYYDNGAIRLEGTADCQNRIDGKFVEYNRDGEILGRGEFDKGVKVGIWTMYFGENSVSTLYYNDDGTKRKFEKRINGEIVESKIY